MIFKNLFRSVLLLSSFSLTLGIGGCTFGPVYKGSEHLEQYSSNFLLGEGHKQFVDGHFKRAAENYCMAAYKGDESANYFCSASTVVYLGSRLPADYSGGICTQEQKGQAIKITYRASKYGEPSKQVFHDLMHGGFSPGIHGQHWCGSFRSHSETIYRDVMDKIPPNFKANELKLELKKEEL